MIDIQQVKCMNPSCSKPDDIICDGKFETDLYRRDRYTMTDATKDFYQKLALIILIWLTFDLSVMFLVVFFLLGGGRF